MLASAEQVRQGARHPRPVQILRDAVIANLTDAEQSLDDVEAALHFGAHFGLVALCRHQTKKGNQWYFSMNAHIGVDNRGKLIHSVMASAANVYDSQALPYFFAR